MASRLNLHEELCEILGSRYVYFQPPESLKLNHPCIIYKLLSPNVKKADNINYMVTKQYRVIVVDSDPDSEIPDNIMKHFNLLTMTDPYTSDGMYHYVFNLYY